MICSDIKILSANVYDSLSEYGYSDARILNFKMALSAITTWFTKNANGQFSEEQCVKYEKHLNKLVADGKRTKQWTNTKLRCLDQVQSYYNSGDIGFNYDRCSRIEYVPSASTLATIETMLSGKKFGRRYKDSLSSYMRRFYCFVEEQGLTERDITTDIMVSFLSLIAKSIPESMCGVGIALSIISDRLVVIGIMEKTPDFKFLLHKNRTKRILSAFSVAEVKAVLDSIDQTTSVGKRNYAIILLAVSTGIRAGDILTLKLTDIDWENHTISIVQSKTNKWLNTTISGQVENAIANYILDGRPNTDAKNIFVRHNVPNVEMKVSMLTKLMDRQCEIAGVEKKYERSFHGLRRTFATLLANEGVDVTKIAQMLGQVKPSSSKVYMSFNNREISKCAMDFTEIPIEGGIYLESNKET